MIRQIYIFIYELYKFFSLIYKICAFLFEFIDKIVDVVMTGTIYLLTDSQKYVMIHIFIIMGLGLVKKYNPLLIFHWLTEWQIKYLPLRFNITR